MKTLELTIIIIIYLMITLFGLNSLKTITNAETGWKNSVEAKTEAEKCAGLVDSLYSNSGGKFHDLKISCHGSGREVFATSNTTTRVSETIAENTISQDKDGESIKVEADNHYEQ